MFQYVNLIILGLYGERKIFHSLSFIDNLVFVGHKTWFELDIQNGRSF